MNPRATEPGNPRVRAFLAGALLVAVTAIAYLPALGGGFVWDDDTTLTDNPLIKAAGGLHRFWFTTQPNDYWPVTYSALWVEWRLWGMNAMGYHAVNVLLHAASACLIAVILRRLLKMEAVAWLAAFIFALHPVNVESVAWITQQKNLWAMLFFLLSIWFFLKAEDRGMGVPPMSSIEHGRDAHATYVASLFSFTLAMLSKGSVAMLPFVLLGLIAWQRRLALRDLARTAPFFVVAATLAAVDVWFQRHGSAEAIRSAGFGDRLLGAGAIAWFYLGKALLPINLIFVYPQWKIHAGNPLWWIPLLAAAGVTVWLLKRRSGALRPALFAWGYFCVMLAPVMGFTDVYFMKYSLVADHYQYPAIVGIVVFAAWVAVKAMGERRPVVAALCRGKWAMGIPVALLCLLGFLTFRQCRIYRDARTLYLATLEKNPDCWLADINLGNILRNEGKAQEAIAYFNEALRLDPQNAEAHHNLGLALYDSGRVGDAIAHYQTALRIKPAYAKAHNNLGVALAKIGRLPEAAAEFEETLRLQPDYPKAHANLGGVLTAEHRLPEAAAQYEEALRVDPNFAGAYFALGNVLLQEGRLPDAVTRYEEALRLDPNNADAHYNLGYALQQMGRNEDAKPHFDEAARLQASH